MKKCTLLSRPTFALLTLVFVCFIAAPCAYAVELTVRNPVIHLLDEVQTQAEAGTTGKVDQFAAPGGKRFLCVLVEVVASDWKEGDRAQRISTKEFLLQVGDETIEASARLPMPGHFILSPPQLYIMKPFQDAEQEVVIRRSAVFVVPKGFTRGTYEIGETMKIEISAADAVPLGSITELADFKVTEVKQVESIERNGSIDGQQIKHLIKPVHGKLVQVSVEVTANKTNCQDGTFVVGTRDLSLEFAGAFTPPTGQMLGEHFSSVTASNVKMGETKTFVYVFVVSEKLRRANLRYHGEKVAEVNLAE